MKRTAKKQIAVEGAPKFWVSPDGMLQRVYFTDGIYIQRHIVEASRGTESYYDRHRTAKGDDTEIVMDTVFVAGTTAEALFAALGKAFGGRESKYRDETTLWDWSREAALGTRITSPTAVIL